MFHDLTSCSALRPHECEYQTSEMVSWSLDRRVDLVWGCVYMLLMDHVCLECLDQNRNKNKPSIFPIGIINYMQ